MGTPLQHLTQPLAHKLVRHAQQSGPDNDTDQGYWLEARPLCQGSRRHQKTCSRYQNQRLHHQYQSGASGTLPLKQQIDQEGHHDDTAGTHTKGQEEGQGIDVEAYQMEPAVALLLRSARQAQGEKHSDAHTTGKYIGVGKDGGHTDPRFHPAQVVIIGGKQPQQA